MEGTFELTMIALAKGYWNFVIANQAGSGRGYCEISDVESVTAWICDRSSEQGVTISKVYYPFSIWSKVSAAIKKMTHLESQILE